MIQIGDDGSLLARPRATSLPLLADTTLSAKFSEVMGPPPRVRALEDKTLDPFYCDVAAVDPEGDRGDPAQDGALSRSTPA